MSALIVEVYDRMARGQDDAFAIRAVAAKYDVADYELALAILEEWGKTL
jgi:hypothetical protein